MRTVQVLIKTFAVFLAGIIIISIIGGVIGVIGLLGRIADSEHYDSVVDVDTVWQEEQDTKQKIKNLEISIGATSVRILESKDDERVRIETNNEYIETWQDSNTLKVVEKSHTIFSGFWGDKDLVIYLPKNTRFDDVKIDAGAGTVKIERLVTNTVVLKLGAGKTSVDYLEAKISAKIDGGAGKVEIKQGELHDLDMEVGAGKGEIEAKVTGDSKIESGVGKLELDLLGAKDDYKFMIDKGIGSVTLNGEKQSDEAIVGQGENLIRIEAGVGAVEITTK